MSFICLHFTQFCSIAGVKMKFQLCNRTVFFQSETYVIMSLESKDYYFNVFWYLLFYSVHKGEGWSFFFCMNMLSNFLAKETIILSAVWFLSHYASRNNKEYTCLFTIFLSVFLSIFNYHGSSRIHTLRSNLGMNKTTPILKKTRRSRVG